MFRAIVWTTSEFLMILKIKPYFFYFQFSYNIEIQRYTNLNDSIWTYLKKFLKKLYNDMAKISISIIENNNDMKHDIIILLSMIQKQKK